LVFFWWKISLTSIGGFHKDGDYYQIYFNFLVELDRERVWTELSVVGIRGGRVIESLIHLLGLC